MNKRHVQHIKPVDSAQVHAALVGVLTKHLPMTLNARDLDEETLWDILLYASFQQTTVESACLELGVSSGTTTRHHLVAALGDSPRDLLDLERQLNHGLRGQLPRSFRHHLNSRRYAVAIDLVELPYYGQPHQRDQELRRNQAKAGTTYFHCYATLAVVHDDQRYELALTFVQAKVSLTEVVLSLLKYARLLGLRIRRAYLDSGNGLKTLCRGQRSYGTRYTFNAKTADT